MVAKKRQFLAMKTSQGTPVATSELPSSSRTPSKLSLLVTFLCMCVANGFAPAPPLRTAAATLHMSYYDMSDYSSGPADYDDDSEVGESAYAGMRDAAEKAAAESEASEVKLEQPPPLSKNAGNAFIALVFDKALDAHGRAWDDLVEDRTETRNLAAAEPARVVAMMAMYDAWALRCGVRPWPLKRGQ